MNGALERAVHDQTGTHSSEELVTRESPDSIVLATSTVLVLTVLQIRTHLVDSCGVWALCLNIQRRATDAIASRPSNSDCCAARVHSCYCAVPPASSGISA